MSKQAAIDKAKEARTKARDKAEEAYDMAQEVCDKVHDEAEEAYDTADKIYEATLAKIERGDYE